MLLKQFKNIAVTVAAVCVAALSITLIKLTIDLNRNIKDNELRINNMLKNSDTFFENSVRLTDAMKERGFFSVAWNGDPEKNEVTESARNSSSKASELIKDPSSGVAAAMSEFGIEDDPLLEAENESNSNDSKTKATTAGDKKAETGSDASRSKDKDDSYCSIM